MSDRTDRITDLIFRYRYPILAALVLVTLFFAFQLRNIRYEISPEGMRISDDPDTIYYGHHLERFGSDEIIVVAIEAEDVFRREVLEKIEALSREIEAYPKVLKVLSISTAVDMRADEFGMEVIRVAEGLPVGEAGMAELKKRILGNPLFVDNLVSRDGAMATIIVTMERENVAAVHEHTLERSVLVKRIQALVERERGEGYELYMAGYPVLTTVMPELLVSDNMRFMPIVLCLVILILFASFRTFRGVALPALTVVASVIWTMGLLVAVGRRVEIITNVIPPMVMVIGLAAAIHILTHYNEELSRDADRRAALSKTLSYVMVPCFLTSITTAIGFGSLMSNQIEAIRDFGGFAAFGVIAAFLVAVTLIPIVLYHLSPPKSPPKGPRMRERLEAGPLGRVLKGLGDFDLNNKAIIIAGSALLIALAAVGISRLRVETSIMKYLKADNPLVVSVNHIEGHITGTATLDLVFEADGEGAILEPRVLAEIERAQAFLESLPEVTKTVSIVDFLKKMNQAMSEGDPAAYRIPDSREAAAQYLLLFSMSGDEENLERFLAYDSSAASLSARVLTVSSAQMDDLITRIQDYIDARPGKGGRVRLTGIALLLTKTIDAIVRGQITSLGIALAIITVMMALLFRSLKVGFISMIPNVLPIITTLGLMGWVGIPINTATAVISCVAIGIAVDDTIHYLVRFRKELEADGDYAGATYRSLTGVGRAMVYTSIVNTGGFLALFFSNFNPIIYFGLLMGFTMMSALVGDLIVLPVCLLLFRPFKVSGTK